MNKILRKVVLAVKGTYYFILRRIFEKSLKSFYLENLEKDKLVNGNVLVDGYFDNPNYWLRWTILRATLGITQDKEIGVLGVHRRWNQRKTLNNFEIEKVEDLISPLPPGVDESFKSKVTDLLDSLEGDETKFLNLKLPYDYPPKLAYDYILKKEQCSRLDLSTPEVGQHLCQLLVCLENSFRIVEKHKPELFVASHAISLISTLVWMVLRSGGRVIVPFGNFGVEQFWKINSPDEIYDFVDYSRWENIKDIYPILKKNVYEQGQEILKKRFEGAGDNLGANYAFVLNNDKYTRESLCELYNWDPNKKIIGVYASNWFDFPHTMGMDNFTSFHEWIVDTYNIAKERTDVNWLFKPHPVDKWYKGMTLSDIVSEYEGNVQIVPEKLNGKSAMDIVDAVITFHGTIGIEATMYGIPVLLADVGWYHDWDFCVQAKSRKEYHQLLNSDWWDLLNKKDAKERAAVFSYLFWSKPSWQKNFLLDDDSKQWALYIPSVELLKDVKVLKELKTEMKFIKNWYGSHINHLHSFKMISEMHTKYELYNESGATGEYTEDALKR